MSAEQNAPEVQTQTTTDAAVVQITTQLAEFDKVAAGIGELEKRYKGIVFDVGISRGMDAAKAARHAVRTPRFAIENKRKALKSPVLELGRQIDARAKEITAALLAIEEPIDEQIKKRERQIEEERQAKVKAEEDRIAGIRARIQTIREMPAGVAMVKPAVITATIESLKQISIDETFQEFRQEASDAKEAALGSLIQLHAAAVDREAEAERVATERAELERRRKEDAERERVRSEEAAAAAAKREQEIEAERAKLKAEREENERIARERQEELDRKEAAQNAEQARITRERNELERLHREQRQRTEVSSVESREGIVDTQKPGIRPDREPGEETSHPATGLARGAVLEPDQRARAGVTTGLTSPPTTEQIVHALMGVYAVPRDTVVQWLIGAVEELLQ